MAHGAAVWLPFVQPFGTVLLGIGAGFIAYRQWRTANNKVRVDLFKDRLEEYAGTLKIFDNLNDRGLSDRDIKNLIIFWRRSKLFFGPDYVDSLERNIENVEQILIALKDQDIDKADRFHGIVLDENKELLRAFEKYASLARIR